MQFMPPRLLILVYPLLCSTTSSASRWPSITSNIMASTSSPNNVKKAPKTATASTTAGYMMKMPPLADKRSVAEQLCQTCSGPIYSQGLETFQVPMALYEVNRARVVQAMLEKDSSAKGLILLEGGKQTTRYDTDFEPVFRQESYFHYLFGASQYSDCYGVLSLPEGEATLFVPSWGVETETVCGPSPEFEGVKKELGLERVFGVGELKSFVEQEMKRMEDDEEENKSGETSSPPNLFLLKGMNTDSGNFATPASFEGIEKFKTVRDDDTLFGCMAECRVTKSPAEVNLLRYTNWISSMAHVSVMRATKPGMMEYQLESLFQHHTYTHGGCRHMSYTCICACGPSANILHYGHAGRPNSRLLTSNDIALLDMGAEYHCYASDITCSFPVSGTFTEDQRAIYESVLAAQVSILGKLKPGVSWLEMHREAFRHILKGLIKCGVLTAGGEEDVDKVVEEMLDADLGAIFMPHGMGHLIGIDTHDVGGYAAGTPQRSTRPGLKNVRTAREMEEGMVLTVEPGCYFIDPLLEMALANDKQKKFINADRLQDFRGFGGVRLEDDVAITADGCENLTLCPRSAEEVMDVMKGGVWPPEKDVMPELKRSWAVCKEGKMEMLDMES
mmetsp:Transcript_28811/g.52149  ORF Transcript_28811/g.52149 Transcript_28811/m.52149 type:complete len:617 (-) Transcript_28811:176-2026(-)